MKWVIFQLFLNEYICRPPEERRAFFLAWLFFCCFFWLLWSGLLSGAADGMGYGDGLEGKLKRRKRGKEKGGSAEEVCWSSGKDESKREGGCHRYHFHMLLTLSCSCHSVVFFRVLWDSILVSEREHRRGFNIWVWSHLFYAWFLYLLNSVLEILCMVFTVIPPYPSSILCHLHFLRSPPSIIHSPQPGFPFSPSA